MFRIVQGLAGEEMDGADFPEHPPPWTVRREHEVLIVISHMLGSGVRRSAQEIKVMNLQELLGHGSRGRHHHVHEAEPQVHERPIGPSQVRQGVVRDGPHVRYVADYGPRRGARREGQRGAREEPEEAVEKRGHDECGRAEKPDGSHFFVEPCDICGDVGFDEVISTCSKCKVTREHLYCMQTYPKKVPGDWVCEYCHSGNGTTSPNYVANKNFSKDFGIDDSDVIDNEFTQPKSPYKLHNFGRLACSRSQKVVGTGKVKFIPEEEAISLLSMGHGKLHRRCGVRKSLLTNQQATHSLSKDPSKEYVRREHSSNSIMPANKEEISSANARKANDKAFCLTAENSLPFSTADLQVEKHSKKAPSAALQARQSSPIVDSGGTCSTSGKCNRSNIDKRDLCSIQMNFNLYRNVLPSSHATWRGGFKFLQNAAASDFYDGLEGQPPCNVHRKAYNFSCKMPPVLEVNPLPTSGLLKDLFENDCPDLRDVALYFFPSDKSERSRQNFIQVFDFLDSKNMMLRSFIDGVELLVVTSKQLNVDSQGTIGRIKAKSFLWGVFRPVKNDAAIETLPDTEDVDMEIDMVGGKDVLGKIDIVQNWKDKPMNLSISSGEGTLLQNPSENVHKSLITSSDLNSNVQDKFSLSTQVIKEIKTEFPSDSDPSLLNYVKDYHKVKKENDVPPGFEEAHNHHHVGVSGFGKLQPPKLKRVCDLSHSPKATSSFDMPATLQEMTAQRKVSSAMIIGL
ncbi:uncharacterized protein G2W53_007009 [Senna tora]|uniref:Zinc finger PHD-type domain-containing protein n=1 Tax=Senna tora TaxID=362788 RepID=A0A834X658_9FABA|nr:uncharacterized protein G2W53_007009 [Senna tora]